MTARPTTPTRESYGRLLLLAWPLIVSQSVWTVQIVLDRILLSQSSTEAVGAGLAAVMLFWMGLALFQFTANYATTFVAQYTGAGQPERVGPIVGQALWFAVFSGLLFLLLVPFAEQIIAWADHEPALQALEVVYFRCLCFAALPILVTAAAGSFFAGRGDTRTVLWMNLVGLAVNGLWAYVLIFGKLGFEPMGIAGAGIATVLGCTASAVYALGALLRPRFVAEYRNGVGWAFDRELFGRLMYFGLPQGVGTAVETAAFSLFLVFIGKLGPTDLAASSIASTLNLLAFLPMMGVGQAVEVMVGQGLGEDRPDEAERSVWAGLGVSLAFTAMIGLLYVAVPTLLTLPFATDQETWPAVQARTVVLLRFVAAYCLFDSVQLMFAFALRGAGDTRFVTWVTACLAFPLMVVPAWASWKYGWGMYVAWASASVYLVILAGVLYGRFRQGRWRTMRVIEERAVEAEPRLEEAGASV